MRFHQYCYYFNSHPHEEDDGFPQCAFQSDTFISTHILTKRMTGDEYSNYIPIIISTHILTKRMTVNHNHFSIFQSLYFNSHPHEEDDNIHSRSTWNYVISTHILTKRMTQRVLYNYTRTSHFNSHPHEEDDSNFKQK